METQAIGEAAGKIWRHLAQNGEVSVSELPKGIQADTVTVHLALGWLSREDKLVLERKGKSVVVRLKEAAALDTRT
jgi:DNA-binding transcriptional ArsR family regulator